MLSGLFSKSDLAILLNYPLSIIIRLGTRAATARVMSTMSNF